MKILLNLIFFSFLISSISCLDKKKDCKCRILPKSKIVGGKQAHHLAYPWMVSISQNKDQLFAFFRKYVKEEKKINFHSCGGTIINEYWILTAAHCIPENKQLPVYVGYGNDNDLVKIYDFGRIESVKLINNPQYNVNRYTQLMENDIALIKLKEPIKFTENIKPACFLNENLKLYTSYLEHAGWGSTEIFKANLKTMQFSRAKIPKNLKEVLLNDQSDSFLDCKFNKNLICAKGLQEGESSCKGDSGGPVHYTKNGKSYVVGLASYVAEEKKYEELVEICLGVTAYTRVSSYIDWIKKFVANDICDF